MEAFGHVNVNLVSNFPVALIFALPLVATVLKTVMLALQLSTNVQMKHTNVIPMRPALILAHPLVVINVNAMKDSRIL